MVAALGSCLVKYVVCALYSLFLGFMLCWLLRKKKKKQEERRRFKISDSGFLIVWDLSNGANVN